ncbi:hypothetical protein [Peribacillus loiseleuriae]|uniref:CbiN domain protein n=1 Tax=Peribacillus loiseleuriae TaxID=1679170 RepID=A0A0K9G822_9BACI|nr:hypothetical protein [Peribacillus loiseleuriae]KMY42803.1 hypothetical protein AC625_24470 [Peribacillus loiseleuriae]
MKQQLTLSIMLFFFLLSMFPNQSKALSCVEIEGPAINHYNAAIMGTVLNVKNDLVQKGFTGLKETKRYVLIDVEKSWKSEFKSQVIFETNFTWGYNFEKGKKYLIYPNEENGIYTNSPCSPVSSVNSSNQYEELLGEGLKPIEKVNLGYKMWFMFDDLDLEFTLLLMVIFLILIWRWYAKRLKLKN